MVFSSAAFQGNWPISPQPSTHILCSGKDRSPPPTSVPAPHKGERKTSNSRVQMRQTNHLLAPRAFSKKILMLPKPEIPPPFAGEKLKQIFFFGFSCVLIAGTKEVICIFTQHLLLDPYRDGSTIISLV